MPTAGYPRWMAGRSIRVAFLALAAWAMLFAPGAAAEDPGPGAERVSPERVAAAIIAPTFGSDGVVAARSCRDDDVSHVDCAPAGDVLSAPSPLTQPRLSSTSPGDERPAGDVEAQQSAPTRAPPTD